MLAFRMKIIHADLTGSVPATEEVPAAEGRRRAAGRGVQGSLHAAGIRQVS